MNKEMIRIEELRKRYRNKEALKGITLCVEEGELFAYLGPNGAGKSTTIRILTGLTRRSSGDAWLNGFHIEKQGIDAKRQCGLVPQSINLDQELTVFENLDIHARLFSMGREDRNRRIEALLVYTGLHERKHHLVKQLSGGLKRRLMIARGMVHSPRILFLDEPTAGLDAGIRRRIWAMIKKIQQKGTTIFLTTHYIEEAEFLADSVAFLDEGRIVARDTPGNLMAAMGRWAMDRVIDDNMETVYFGSRKEAEKITDVRAETCTLRRVNLEDAYLAITGKKVK